MKRLSLLILVAASACTYTDSENVKSSGIYAHYSVVHEVDDRVKIAARYTVGGPLGTVVVLSGEDHLEVDGQAINGLSAVRAPSSDGTYDLTLVRSDEAITTTVTVPAKPAISSTTPGTMLRDGDTLTIAWNASAPATQVLLAITGPCVATLSAVMPDTGTFTTPPLRTQTGHEFETCPIEVRLNRGASFGVDSSFDGGITETHHEAATALQFRGIAAS